MNWTRILLTTFVLMNLTVISFAQKGVGDNSGIARTGLQNQVNAISGRLVEVLDESCTETTGKYAMGTHLLIRNNVGDDNQILNIHLGPTTRVSEMVDKLESGMDIDLQVYHADGFPDNHFVAKSFSYGNNHYKIRDANLRPFWANSDKGRKKSRW